MPYRGLDFVNDHYYHVFNRNVPGLNCFIDERECRHFIETLWYYNLVKPPLRFTKYLHSSWDVRKQWKLTWEPLPQRIKMVAYCLMQNHYHFLVQQSAYEGISTFIRLLQNSFAHYHNTKNKRVGPVFTGRFKAVLIENNNQLLHVSRYIHLNPVTAYIVRSIKDLNHYPWSSWNEYHGQLVERPLVNPNIILKQFKNTNEYDQFCASAVDYERELKSMQKLILDAQDDHTRSVHLKPTHP
jgi:putative transposase